ncbi:hypothetical protein TrVE_jg3274 [Triparma verrucosa]|uniref:Uncharacterized protein n=1 Tax=Triparma verrucosa TaxID=1606542 RepID=A0A9W7BDY0_9STRA|nr:hypothetical protein TrVE_jg3274 [Triparma verrucosa]|mmetsp:Transcript_583/g.1032  ORF Transcript_583/g.1032 Transcript_583/m.1032 type:complete len:363 (+) Transcript_583:47-1135(+)
MSSGMMLSTGPTSSVSIGNYKGVMLCHRPFAGASGAAGKVGKTTQSEGSFKCGTVETPLGENVKISEHQKMVAKMSKKNSVLSKHRKWLSDLQKTKEKLQEEYLEEEAAAKEKKEKFMEREAKMRAVVRGTIGPTKHRQEELALLEETKGQAEEKKEGNGDGPVPPLNLAEPKKSVPAWAMTESVAKEVEDQAMEEEEEDLLAFADGLDYDKYEDDLELKVLMDQVKERIKNMEKDGENDEKALQALLDRELERAIAADREAQEEEYAEEKEGGREDDDVKEIVNTVREEEGMKEVHSNKSLLALVEQRKEALAGEGAMETVKEEAALAQPRIITHTDDGGSRMKGKEDVNKLPYMNRNPAV